MHPINENDLASSRRSPRKNWRYLATLLATVGLALGGNRPTRAESTPPAEMSGQKSPESQQEILNHFLDYINQAIIDREQAITNKTELLASLQITFHHSYLRNGERIMGDAANDYLALALVGAHPVTQRIVKEQKSNVRTVELTPIIADDLPTQINKLRTFKTTIEKVIAKDPNGLFSGRITISAQDLQRLAPSIEQPNRVTHRLIQFDIIYSMDTRPSLPLSSLRRSNRLTNLAEYRFTYTTDSYLTSNQINARTTTIYSWMNGQWHIHDTAADSPGEYRWLTLDKNQADYRPENEKLFQQLWSILHGSYTASLQVPDHLIAPMIASLAEINHTRLIPFLDNN